MSIKLSNARSMSRSQSSRHASIYSYVWVSIGTVRILATVMLPIEEHTLISTMWDNPCRKSHEKWTNLMKTFLSDEILLSSWGTVIILMTSNISHEIRSVYWKAHPISWDQCALERTLRDCPNSYEVKLNVYDICNNYDKKLICGW